MKFKYRETGENWKGGSSFGKKLRCVNLLVDYKSHVLFQGVYRINQLYLAFSSIRYKLSQCLLLKSQASRGSTQSNRKFDTSDLFR